MSPFASDVYAPPGNAIHPFAWPANDDPLRLPRGPISQSLVRALLGGGRGGARLAERGAWRPWVVMAADRERDGEPVGPVCPLTLDVALVVLDLLRRGDGAAPVNARAVLARKGYGRWGRERQAFEARIVAQLRLLQNLRLLSGDGAEPLLNLGPRNVARTDFVVRATPPLSDELGDGGWTEIPNAVLRLDHRRNRGADVLAKKLAVAIALAGASGVFRVADLLARVGCFPETQSPRPRTGIAERVPAALRRLQALGVFDIEGLEAIERQSHGRPDWLSAQIRIHQGSAASAPAAYVTSGGGDPETVGVPSAGRPRRGRPRFAPSAQQRDLVRLLQVRGATRGQIAKALGISLPTLRCYFAAELRKTSEPWLGRSR
jgi:hypothetical protein